MESAASKLGLECVVQELPELLRKGDLSFAASAAPHEFF